MRYCYLLMTAMATLLTVSAAQQPGECDLSDPASLGRCLKQMLINVRDKVRHKLDPLHLPGSNKDGIETRDVVIQGLSAFSVPELTVTFPSPRQFSLRASIAWPNIAGDLFVRARKCKKVFWRNWCASVSATPHVTVGHTVGSLTTTLTVNVTPSGQISVSPGGTRVSLNLPAIRVKANLRSKVARFINRIIGDPASKIASKLSNQWWRKNKTKIEAKARDALDKAVRDNVSVHLAQFLSL